MLKREVLSDRTYELLKKIMSNDDFNDFILFGGTALALQIGHRKSVDLDFITENKEALTFIRNKLSKHFNFNVLRITNDILICDVDGVKVDFVYEKSIRIDNIVVEDGIRLMSIKDICAMKLMAISDNGSRLKDYIDVAILSNYFSFNDMIMFFSKKYNINSTIIPVRPLCDFSMIDINQKLVIINMDFDFAKCKKRIIDMVANPDKVLNND